MERDAAVLRRLALGKEEAYGKRVRAVRRKEPLVAIHILPADIGAQVVHERRADRLRQTGSQHDRIGCILELRQWVRILFLRLMGRRQVISKESDQPVAEVMVKTQAQVR